MVRFFFVGLGEFLTFAATALTILVNMGQLTENIVARNFFLVSLNTDGLANSVTASGTTANAGSLYAPNQAAAIGQGQGVKANYYWGMYSVCGGAGINKNRDCSDTYIGYRFEPAQTLRQDAPAQYDTQLQNLLGSGKFADNDYLSRYSRVANIIILTGTILTGLAFLTGFLAHRFCFAFAALEALGAAGCLAVGAAMWTAIIYKARASIPGTAGLDLEYGRSLWMLWAAFGAMVLSIIPLLLACCLGRSKY